MAVLPISVAQETDPPFFTDGEGVNFIGNSITHGTSSYGSFHNYIFLYYATRFPNEKVAFYNSGKWGDNANSFLKRMDDDILVTNADWSVVMAGMNDVNRTLYRPGSETDPDIETKRARALSDYRGYMKQVIEKLQAAGTQVILQKPSIYDQTGDLSAENWYGVNDALQECTSIIDELAQEYQVQVVDYYTILNELNLQVQQDDPTATVISTDRIHPHSPGNFIMAYQFLKETNAPKYVANIQIANNSLAGCDNCTVSDLSIGEDQISFNYTAESLPFPVADDAASALSLIPFSEELNTEQLKIENLAPGNYALSIDGGHIESFSHEELQAGVNLALYKNTPQYRQALAVMSKTDAYKQQQVVLRDIVFVEYNILPVEARDDFEAGKAYIDDLKETGSTQYLHNKARCDAYLLNKPNEAALEAQLNALRDEIYTINKPEAHAFLLKTTNSLITHIWDFNDPVVNRKVEGWEIVTYDNPTTSDGILHLSGSEHYNHIMYRVPTGTIDPTESNQVVIRVKNETLETTGRFYWWTTEVEAAFVDFEISASDTEFKEYTVDLSEHKDWTGEITIIRFNMPFPIFAPSFDKPIHIDYVKLETASETEPEPEPEPEPGIHVWDFNEAVVANKVEGWQITDYDTPSTVDGILHLSSSKNYPNIMNRLPAGEIIDPVQSDQVMIRVKNETSETKARFYWWRSGADAVYVEFDISANDTEFKEYIIDLSGNEDWTGEIIIIRLNMPFPIQEPSFDKPILIDYVKVGPASETEDPEPEPEPEPGDKYIWNFDGPVEDRLIEGWKIYNYDNPATVDGILNLSVSTRYNNLDYVVPSADIINPEEMQNVTIRLKNETSNKDGRFYWWSSEYEAVYVEFTMTTNDSEFKEYVIDLSLDERWTGDVSRIRFDVPIPVTEVSYGKAINVDYIKLTEQQFTIPQMPERDPAPFGVNLSGAEFGNVPGVLNSDYGYPTLNELKYFKSKGLSLVRFPFKWERIQRELNGDLDPDELIRMKNFLNAARSQGVWVLLDMHNYGRRKIDETTYLIGDPLVSVASVADAWKKLADEFKSYDNIWGYGIMNEPYAMLASTPWFDIAQAIITDIREVDTATPIVVGGDSYSSAERWRSVSDNLKNLEDPSDNLIFEAHVYFDKDASGKYAHSYDAEGATPNSGITRVAPFVEWLEENNFRGFIGEYGVPDDDDRWLIVLDNFLKHLSEKGINGTYWSAGPRWGDYKLAVEPKDGVDRPQMATLEKYLRTNGLPNDDDDDDDDGTVLNVEEGNSQKNPDRFDMKIFADKNGNINANVYAPKTMKGNLVMFDMLGSKLVEKEYSLSKGHNLLKMQIEGLPTGIYIASFVCSDEKVSKRFLIK